MSESPNMTLTLLDEQRIAFPPTSHALGDPNGLLALGGELTPDWLLAAYQRGIFPWFSDDQPILWWSPSPRCVVLPEQVHISRSLGKVLRRGKMTVTFDQAFDRVIDGCRAPRDEDPGTWITGDIRAAYIEMHRLGHAHSVETWLDGALVGGLYGLSLGQVFFGESMFQRATDASKVAFIYLARQLQRWGYGMIDCQVSNPHLLSLGAIELDRKAFELRLRHGLKQTGHARPWKFSTDLFESG